MKPDRWRKVDELFAAALERDREERAAFLDQACADDPGLRREVEKMLKCDEQVADFIESDVFNMAAGLMTGETEHLPPGRAAEKKGAPRKSQPSFSSDSIDDARFIPGDVLSERYRIFGLLGRGGMGEVYRADDLKLKQPVALKFLPESVSADGAALSRFYKEVSVARQISHRHVCRVYDVGEYEGHHFISMEFVRGEELSSLLKRIGRLPQDKAAEIARQLCAGLAAVHERGVLHRDLKPANIMVDEQGDVRITDFGIAALAEEIRGREAMAGTPAYMSPEQLEGHELTVRSDIYSLGLVLYEVFTGKKAFEASTLPELLRLRRTDTAPTSPSELVANLDPLVERVIFRCLEKDPDKRPASALKVAAALPGGDPLAAALAAGETPSPEMVAAAPKEGGLRIAVAIILFTAIIVGLAISLVVVGKTSLHAFTPLEKPPDVLRERAREITREFGYTNPAVDDEYEFGFDDAARDYMAGHDPSPDRWRKLKTGQPAVIYYWHRQSPQYLEPIFPLAVSLNDPPPIQSGMTGVRLDMRGRLLRFYAVPSQVEEGGTPAAAAGAQAFDWSPLFKAAGFEMSSFRAAESKWLPPYPFDARAAWEGVYPENPQIPLRVEAASYHGKPVYFEVVNPWDKPARQEPEDISIRRKALLILGISIFAAMLAGILLLAVRNLRRGRGDRKGALRLALFIFTCELLWHLSVAHHVPTVYEFAVIMTSLPFALFSACFFSLLYLALEPSIRRRRPHSLISWQRLLAGGFRDPMVGRDFLVGALAGIALIVFGTLPTIPALLTGKPFQPPFQPGDVLLGLDFFLPAFATQLRTSFFFSFPFLFLLHSFSMLFRSDRRGAVACWFIVALSIGLISASWIGAVLATIVVWIMYRYGWLALSVMMVFIHISIFFPLSTDLAAWYMRGTVLNLLILLAATAYAFRISLGGQKLLRGAFPDD